MWLLILGKQEKGKGAKRMAWLYPAPYCIHVWSVRVGVSIELVCCCIFVDSYYYLLFIIFLLVFYMYMGSLFFLFFSISHLLCVFPVELPCWLCSCRGLNKSQLHICLYVQSCRIYSIAIEVFLVLTWVYWEGFVCWGFCIYLLSLLKVPLFFFKKIKQKRNTIFGITNL